MMIKTERLLLRPFDCNDLDIVMELYCDDEIMKYMPYPVLDREGARDLLNRFVTGWEIDQQINYEMAVILRETDETIGRAEITRYFEEDSAMIGWVLKKAPGEKATPPRSQTR